VGNLPYKLDEAELEQFFSDCGQVEEVIIIKERGTGRSKGFGFVTFADEDSTKKAIEKNDTEFKGRALRINEAKERT